VLDLRDIYRIHRSAYGVLSNVAFKNFHRRDFFFSPDKPEVERSYDGQPNSCIRNVPSHNRPA